MGGKRDTAFGGLAERRGLRLLLRERLRLVDRGDFLLGGDLERERWDKGPLLGLGERLKGLREDGRLRSRERERGRYGGGVLRDRGDRSRCLHDGELGLREYEAMKTSVSSFRWVE